MDLFRSVFPACGYVAWGSVCLGRYSRVRCSHTRVKAWVGDIRINVHLKFILSWDCVYRLINPSRRHHALKHHSTSQKTYFIFLQPRVLESIFPWNWFTNIWQSSLIFHPHPLQVENCDSNSRLVVDEDDNGKFRLEKVKAAPWDNINFRF